jgi:hypothetical protein
MPVSFRVFLIISCSSLNVSGITLRSLIDVELIFAEGEEKGSSFSLLHVHNQFSRHHLLQRLFFLQ